MLAFRTNITVALFRIGVRSIYGSSRIGKREVVGHGCNGMYNYKDDAHFPFPAIRFKENSPEVLTLRDKELGDWRELSKQEKKSLYRASFCQTFVEFKHPTGQWKAIIGAVLIFVSFGFWIQIFYHHYVKDEMPSSLSLESQRAQLRRMLDLKVNPIDGLSSLWDYENNCWKK